MAGSDFPADPAASDGPTWREMAVARSLESARARAEGRVQRFLDAASELIGDGSGTGFTVQEVVERSGQSLRSFYQYFDGKHELLLALFEESVRATAEVLTQRVADESEPLGRLHRFVVEYYRLCRPSRRAKGKRAGLPMMAEFGQELLTHHPRDAARAFQPLVAAFRDVLEEAAAVGAVRPELDRARTAGIVLEAVMFNAFSSTIGGWSERGATSDPAEELWDLIFHGIGG